MKDEGRRAKGEGREHPHHRWAPLLRPSPFALLFLSLAWTTAPQLVSLAREAWSLHHLPLPARRLRINGPMPAAVAAIKKALPKDEPVALIGPEHDYAPAIFANYYAFPWRSREYAGLDHYRALAGRPRPTTIVSVGETARLTTYAELRDQRLRHGRVVRTPPTQLAPRNFIIPLAGSVDSVAPDTYVTEADFANEDDTAARLRLTLMPEGRARNLTVAPHATLSFYDLVYQNFGIMEVRAVAVAVDRPLRTGIWFVNRGRNEAVPLPFVLGPEPAVLRCPAEECKLWLLDMESGALDSSLFRGTAEVWKPGVFAFASTKNPPTRFVWPMESRVE